MLKTPSGFLLLDVALGVATLFLLKRLYLSVRATIRGQSLRHPPGPTPLPLVGNLFDMPKPNDKEWLHWAKHKDLYGPISSVTAFGQTVIILNDHQVAVDLFEKRSANYSDRPILVFGGEMCGWNDMFSLLPKNSRLQTARRLMHKFIGTPKIMERFHELIHLETRRLLLRISEDPKAIHDHLRAMAGAIILNMSHGYRVNQIAEDPLVKLADAAMQQFSETLTFGKYLVDIVPALRHLPDWFPGTNFKQIAKVYRRTFMDFKTKPHAFVKEQMREGLATPSFTADILEQEPLEDESYIQGITVALFAGGSDTTVSFLRSFLLAMALFPEVQKKAQAEIDAVVGWQRLPTFDDRPKLPYLEAIVKETHRWNPVAPMAFSHSAAQDDIYRGYFIPKGMPILSNVWQFTHDAAVYHDPMVYKPERFLESANCPPEKDPRGMVFGFGRRICPGRQLVNTSVHIAMAMILAVFDVKLPKDATGKEIKPNIEYTSGIISHPMEYECIITSRSENALSLARAVENEHPLNSGDAAKLMSLETMG